jgi:hypothetical protein
MLAGMDQPDAPFTPKEFQNNRRHFHEIGASADHTTSFESVCTWFHAFLIRVVLALIAMHGQDVMGARNSVVLSGSNICRTRYFLKEGG